MTTDRVQVLDLGQSRLTAVAGTSAKGGILVLDELRVESVPIRTFDLDAYVQAIEPILADLARTVFAQRNPVYLVCHELSVRSGIQRLSEVPVALAQQMVRSSFQNFVNSFGSRGSIVGGSCPLRRQPVNGHLDIAVVHAFTTEKRLFLLRNALAKARLVLGGILSPIVAMAWLGRSIGARIEGFTPRILVDGGFASTRILLTDDVSPLSQKTVYVGTADLIDELRLRPALEGAADVELERLLVDGDPAGGESPLVRRGDPAAEIAHVREVTARWLDVAVKAIDLAIETMVSPPVADEDEGDEVGSGSGKRVPLPGPVGLMGGFPLVPGFVEKLENRLGVECRVVDPTLLVTRTTRRPVPEFTAPCGTAIGSLGFLSEEEGASANFAAEYTSIPELNRVPTEDWRRTVAVLASVILVTLLLVTGGLLCYRFRLQAETVRHTQSLEHERSRLPSADDAKVALHRFRKVRLREVVAGTRLLYLASVLDARPAWGALFEQIRMASPGAGFSIVRAEVETVWPETGATHRVRASRGKSHRCKITGEVSKHDTATLFVQNLKKAKLFVNPQLGDTQLFEDNNAAGRRGDRRYSFTVTGEIDFSRGRRP